MVRFFNFINLHRLVVPPVNARVPQDSILSPNLFVLCNNDLHVICDIAIYNGSTILCSRFEQVCDIWQQLQLISEPESDLPVTIDWARSDFLISLLEKFNLFC